MNMTIYINKENTEHLALEKNKSGLINSLLAEYFATFHKLTVYEESSDVRPDISKIRDLPDGKITIHSGISSDNKFKELVVDACPHGYAIGLCKKAECNKKYVR